MVNVPPEAETTPGFGMTEVLLEVTLKGGNMPSTVNVTLSDPIESGLGSADPCCC